MNEVATLPLQQDPTNGKFLPGHCLSSKNAFYTDPAIMEAGIDDYFSICEGKDNPPHVTGMALHLGFTGRQALFNYMQRPGRNPFLDVIKRAKARIEDHRMTSMLTNRNNVIAGIFDLKNNHNYIDKQVNESNVKVAQVIAPEDREALKDLALKMIEAQENDALLVEELDTWEMDDPISGEVS
jgi:hypothetical protein